MFGPTPRQLRASGLTSIIIVNLHCTLAALISSSARHSAMVLMLRKADSRAPAHGNVYNTQTWERVQHSNMGMWMCTILKHGNVDNTQTWGYGQHSNMGMCTTLKHGNVHNTHIPVVQLHVLSNYIIILHTKYFLILHNQKLQTIKNYGLNTQDEFWSYAFPLYETEKLLFCTTQHM